MNPTPSIENKIPKPDLKDRMRELLQVRVENEIEMARLIRQGVDTDQITVNEGANLMSKNKDSITELGKALGYLTTESEGGSINNFHLIHQQIIVSAREAVEMAERSRIRATDKIFKGDK